jgi:hypothetical protein
LCSKRSYGSAEYFLERVARRDQPASEGIDRSALIQAAVQQYIESKRCDREEEKKRKKIQEASRKMDALAKKLG